MEEEKKQRTFHANPIPKKVGGGGPISSRLNSSRASRVSIYYDFMYRCELQNIVLQSNDSINMEENKFKARPASVVHKKPFVPKKPDHQLTICEFSLSTEKRAKEREEFDKLVKERENEIEKMKQLVSFLLTLSTL